MIFKVGLIMVDIGWNGIRFGKTFTSWNSLFMTLVTFDFLYLWSKLPITMEPTQLMIACLGIEFSAYWFFQEFKQCLEEVNKL